MPATNQIAGGRTNPAFALALIAPVYLMNSIDRQVMSVVIEPVRREFALTDTMLGLLGGFAFGLMFAVASIPIGLLIDRSNRVRLLATLVTGWSALTALCGFATSYWTLLIARMGVGAAEAGGSPTAMSLISDYFSVQKRATAIGICYLCTALGVSVSFLLGSMVAATYGWRAAFFVAGIPGVILGLCIWLFLREPPRGQSDGVSDDMPTTPARLTDALATIGTNPVLRHLVVAITISSFVTATVWIWATSLFLRFHGLELIEAGRVIAFAALFQAAGAWVGGMAGDRFAKGSVRNLGKTAAFFAAFAVPSGLLLALSSSTPLAIAGLCLTAFFCGGWLGPAFAMAMGTADAKIRGMTASTIQLVCNLLGAGSGPILTGALSDRLEGGLAHALAVSMLFSLWAAAHYLLAMRAAPATSSSTAGEAAPALH